MMYIEPYSSKLPSKTGKALSSLTLSTTGFLVLLISLPMGAGAQNTASLIVLMLWAMPVLNLQSQKIAIGFLDELKFPFGVLIAFLLWCSAASILTSVESYSVLKFFLSWLPFAILPWMAFSIAGQVEQKWISRTLTLVLMVMIIAMVSQRLDGWALSRGQIIWDKHRVQIFYSHPMTAAYVVGILLSALIPKFFMMRTFNLKWATIGCGLLFGVYATESRTVQIGILIITVLLAWIRGTSRIRKYVALGLMLLIAAIGLTENRAKQKFIETVESTSSRSQSGEFVDDRLIFWFVHGKMFLDRPILGFGVEVDQETRVHYYNESGFSELRDKYEAHNQYIQWAVEAGLLGLMLGCVWLFSMMRTSWRMSQQFWEMGSIAMSFLFLTLTMMTQNALNDSEVRHALLVVVCVALARVGNKLQSLKVNSGADA
jgi:O-antigen ligase